MSGHAGGEVVETPSREIPDADRGKGVAMVGARDIAEVAAIERTRRATAEAKLPIETINVVEPDTLTGKAVDAIWSDVLGRQVA